MLKPPNICSSYQDKMLSIVGSWYLTGIWAGERRSSAVWSCYILGLSVQETCTFLILFFMKLGKKLQCALFSILSFTLRYNLIVFYLFFGKKWSVKRGVCVTCGEWVFGNLFICSCKSCSSILLHSQTQRSSAAHNLDRTQFEYPQRWQATGGQNKIKDSWINNSSGKKGHPKNKLKKLIQWMEQVKIKVVRYLEKKVLCFRRSL